VRGPATTGTGLFPSTYEIRRLVLAGENWVRELNDAQLVEVGLGETIRGVVIVYDAQDGYDITGRVTNIRGQPVERASVRARSDLHVYTNAEGVYLIKSWQEENYRLSVWHRDYTTVTRDGIVDRDQPVDFVLKERGAIAGQVIDNRTGHPVSNFEIREHTRRASRFRDAEFVRVHDPEGPFHLSNVETGERMLLVRAAGYAPQWSQKLTVRVGETTEGVVLKLESGAVVEGIMLDPEGNPVKDARPFLDSFPATQMVIEEYAKAVTGGDGTFRVESAPMSAEAIYAYHFRYAPASAPVQPLPNVVNRVELRFGEGAVLEGFVHAEGAPVVGENVTISDVSPAVYQDRTRDDGRYQIKALPAGEVSVVVSTSFGTELPNWFGWKQIRTADLEEGEVTELDFDFDPWETRVEGRVTVNGEVLNPTRVIVMLQYEDVENGAGTFNTMPDEHGHFTLNGARPGPAVMQVWALDLQHATTSGRPSFSSRPIEILEDNSEYARFRHGNPASRIRGLPAFIIARSSSRRCGRTRRWWAGRCRDACPPNEVAVRQFLETVSRPEIKHLNERVSEIEGCAEINAGLL